MDDKHTELMAILRSLFIWKALHFEFNFLHYHVAPCADYVSRANGALSYLLCIVDIFFM
jgi:hypothetical protein